MSTAETTKKPAPTTTPIRTTSNASSSSSATTSTPLVALPSDEALEILLSPDGYYTYLGIPKPDPSSLVSPILASPAAPNDNYSAIDLDQVKKNYRRLSLKHHPDRKGGDEETFRALNRAKVVLSSPKLRREYDLVGLDLEDDDNHHYSDDASTMMATRSDDGDNSNGGRGAHSHHRRQDSSDNDRHPGGNNNHNSSKTETIMSHLASATLAIILQMVVRTGLMGITSVILSRYMILTILTIGMLFFLSTKIYSALKIKVGGGASGSNTTTTLDLLAWKDVFVPLMIALGVFCMYRGRRYYYDVDDVVGGGGSRSSSSGGGDYNQVVGDSTVGGITTTEKGTTTIATTTYAWTWTFWFGETLVMTLFLANSIEKSPSRSPGLLAMFTTISGVFALWLRGQFWRYATLLGFQGVIALLVVLAFPIMEMILEQIVEEKMKKVGEKIRAHDARLRELLRKKKCTNDTRDK